MSWATPSDPERGSITLLSIGAALLALTLVLVVASASAVHLDRKRLTALADQMAADAATAVDLGAYYGQGAGGGVPVSDGTVRRAAEEHLARVSAGVAGRLDGVRIVAPTGSPDGRTAQVSLAAVTRPPLVPWVLLPWSEGIALRVTSTATAGAAF